MPAYRVPGYLQLVLGRQMPFFQIYLDECQKLVPILAMPNEGRISNFYFRRSVNDYRLKKMKTNM